MRIANRSAHAFVILSRRTRTGGMHAAAANNSANKNNWGGWGAGP
jgi:hypothetical protein